MKSYRRASLTTCSSLVSELFHSVSTSDWNVLLIVFFVPLGLSDRRLLQMFRFHKGWCSVLFPQQSHWEVFVFVFRSQLIALCSVSTALTEGDAQTAEPSKYGASNRFEPRTAVSENLDIVT